MRRCGQAATEAVRRNDGISTALRRVYHRFLHVPHHRRSVIAALASEDDQQRRARRYVRSRLYWKPLYKYCASRAGARLRMPRIHAGFLASVSRIGSMTRMTVEGELPHVSRCCSIDLLRMMKASLRQKRGGDLSRLDFDNAEPRSAREHDRAGSPRITFSVNGREAFQSGCREAAREAMQRVSPSSKHTISMMRIAPRIAKPSDVSE